MVNNSVNNGTLRRLWLTMIVLVLRNYHFEFILSTLRITEHEINKPKSASIIHFEYSLQLFPCWFHWKKVAALLDSLKNYFFEYFNSQTYLHFVSLFLKYNFEFCQFCVIWIKRYSYLITLNCDLANVWRFFNLYWGRRTCVHLYGTAKPHDLYINHRFQWTDL